MIGLVVGAGFQFLPQNKVLLENHPDSKIYNAVLEKSNFWGAKTPSEFGHTGNWEEKPEGIEKIDVSVKLIPSLDGNKNEFLLAYRSIIALAPQSKKITKKFSDDGKTHFVGGYGVNFYFYFLDEDGYCLKKVITENQETLSSPGAESFSIQPGNGPEVMQKVLINEKIPEFLAKRIRKVCFWPVFNVNSWMPDVKSNNET